MRIVEVLREIFEPSKQNPISGDQVQELIKRIQSENDGLPNQTDVSGEIPTGQLEAIIWNNNAISDLRRSSSHR